MNTESENDESSKDLEESDNSDEISPCSSVESSSVSREILVQSRNEEDPPLMNLSDF